MQDKTASPFMSQLSESQWRAEWAAAATPKGPIKNICMTLTEASRDGRAKVAGCGPQPTEPRILRCSLSHGKPPMTSPMSKRHPPEGPTASRQLRPEKRR